MKSPFLSVLIEHLLMLTIVFGTVYAVVQQSYRMSANDPQIQIAEDTASELQKGTSPVGLLDRATSLDISSSLAPFVIVYDATGKPVSWSGTLDGTAPTLPDGVLDNTKGMGENRVTWQPRSNVRIATVIKSYSGTNSGYVLAGRSLREVERRESQLLFYIALGWIASLVIDALCIWIRRKNDIL